MEIKTHLTPSTKIAELISDKKLVNSVEEGFQIMIDLYYQDYDKIIMQEYHFNAKFFDLKTRIFGDLLQKFSNYKVKLAIIGKFSKYESKSFQDFIKESNQQKRVFFLSNLEEAIHQLNS
ncbi:MULTISPECIES: DUF4180 domain-containing protein [unclassified Lentimicrobium]|uniref:DUF4180 domain-containing protein n=1 Tax=unclassified Lentimicrobium TaxID=2677434 RepID=UPI0015557E40|nr:MULTISPECIES: DUF4180 domain-containing protein [unclassified Lentimicrobium]NPD46329.1 DUF4180 domain-containing protein [Lentimicrobium sp. S6]NPD85757.1 DUF4180 domain-containing protein [Lentimicrobium sp. L6]